ncbi:hypothetical protein HJC23_004447 [Cyclotella cryptica]|uniref:Uncharacterized protein n=1 Tax=Cyclotella cryptica TaxID=29204 RepID=A0ABD3QGR8_9STRA
MFRILHGLALPMAEFFKKSMTVVMEYPHRAKTFGETKTQRSLSPLVSWDEVSTLMPFIFGIRYDETNFNQVSPPMNLPPRWKNFERGRVLVSMNTTHENSSPTIKDSVEANTKRSNEFWSNPYPSALIAKEQTDLYFETFHGISRDGSLEGYKYEHDSLILPYLPYFSNCREFDSYIPFWAIVESSSMCKLPGVTVNYPEDWWRRKIPPLPHQDDIKAIGPLNFMEFYPIADWCERKLHCHYEENLSAPDVIPRWFEADSGVTLFSVIRDPIDYFDYTGRDSVTIGHGDGGGQRFIHATQQLQTFIPAKVYRSPAFNVEGGCTTACFPRKVTLDISYQQVDIHTKRIVQVKLLFDKFDKNASDDKYELQIKFYALNYQELVIKFAFSRGLFLLLFSQIGIGTVITAFAYWIVIRLTTSLENPPSLRITKFLSLIFPSAFGGVILGLIPISFVTASLYYLLKGHMYLGKWLVLPTIPLNYSDVGIDPDHLQFTRQGRTGFAFLSMALASFYFTSSMFVPNRKLKANPSNITLHGEHSDKTVAWRRCNLIYSSILMGLFLVVIVEWSFWGSFGTYIWEAIIFMKFLSMVVGSIVDAQLGEALLSAPVMTAMGLVQGIVTMSANDFMDFLLSYIVGFGFLIIERMYIGPLQADFVTWVVDTSSLAINRMSRIFNRPQQESQEGTIIGESLQEENNETLEPLLGSFASYSCDTLSLLYSPFIMVVIMIFQDETEITKMYGIKEADMEYYVLFAIAIIPFQIIVDVLLHNSLELLHGWKILDYLEYCRVRFFQREVSWKGLENNAMDECIEESLRSIDHVCFSSQYYMMNTIHVNGIVYFVMGVEMMARANYNLFADPAMLPIFATVVVCSMTVRLLMIWLGRLAGVWRVRPEKRNWHEKMQIDGDANIDQLGDIHTTSHDLFQMEIRMTEDLFRYKFLQYNRSWIINQLPNLLTPRITQRSRPYMINQLGRVLGSINADISSDSDGDDDIEFDIPTLHASTRTMLRNWLTKASRLLKLRRIVQPLIQQSRGNECQVCLSRNLLQVETFYTIEQMDEMFLKEYGASDDQLDQVLWKTFFRKMQMYQTICLPCIQERKRKHDTELLNDDKEEDMGPDIAGQPEGLNRTSTVIMAMWHAKARAALEYEHSVNHD